MELAGTAGKGAGFGAATAFERGEGPPPTAGHGPFDRQHLAQIGSAAVTSIPSRYPAPQVGQCVTWGLRRLRHPGRSQAIPSTGYSR